MQIGAPAHPMGCVQPLPSVRRPVGVLCLVGGLISELGIP